MSEGERESEGKGEGGGGGEGEGVTMDAVSLLLRRLVDSRSINEVEAMVGGLLSAPSPPPLSLLRHPSIALAIAEGILHPFQAVRYLALRSFTHCVLASLVHLFFLYLYLP